MAYTQDTQYVSLQTPLGKDKLLLRRMQGEEGISQLFHFQVEAQSEDIGLDFKAVVGQHATLTVELADGSQRFLDGLVTRFVQAGNDPKLADYVLELRPWFWLLQQSADCRIFQNQSVPDIITGLFDELGFSDYKNSLTGTYTPREYCVQYNETSYDFVCRLLEEEGICYFFEHSDGKHTLVLADDATAFVACPGGDTVSYGDPGEWTQQNRVIHCTVEENMIAAAVALDDFNFETPSTDLVAEVESSTAQQGGTRRLYEYPGIFAKKNEGDSRAKVRIEEQEAPLKSLRGDSYCRAFGAGYRFTLEDHYRDDVNAEYVLLRIWHRFDAESYQNSFESFPSSTIFRPPRTAPKPVIPGTQTALVVGKKGEEIWTDKYGRIKVQFHWDQLGKNDENSSCWIRVAHGWAGKSWGQIYLPRIGQEVVVSFLEGNPDRPLITGSVYNAEQTVPYALPANQTQSTMKSNTSKGGKGFNEVRFEDKKGSEELYFHAQKDQLIEVENDRTKKVKGKEVNTITKSRHTTIEKEDETLLVKKGDRTVKVETGKELHEVKGTRQLTVTGDETHTNKANVDITVDKNYTLTVKGNLTIDVTGTVTIQAGKTMTLKSGQAMTLDSGASTTMKAASSITVDAGASLTAKAATSLTNQAGTSLTNKAGTTMTNDAGISLTNKGAATQTVDGGGMLTLKAGLIKIN